MTKLHLFVAAAVLALSGGAVSQVMRSGPPATPQTLTSQLQATGGVADPAAFVLGVYDPTKTTPQHEKGYVIETARLAALMKDGEGAEGEVGRLELNFWTNAQDDDIKTATVLSYPVEGAPNRRVVTARFVNFETPTLIHTYWERSAEGQWYLDDAHNVPLKGFASAPWTLSLVLKYGDYGSLRDD